MAGFGRNGSRSSAKAIASAERHGVWIALRRQGHLEKDIASRYGVSQQAVSKALLKYGRKDPAEARLIPHHSRVCFGCFLERNCTTSGAYSRVR